MEQAAHKAPDAEAHPVRVQSQLLQKTLGKQTQVGSSPTDYVGTFFTYCSTLAAILLRSLSSEPGKGHQSGSAVLAELQTFRARERRVLDEEVLDAALAKDTRLVRPLSHWITYRVLKSSHGLGD